MKANSKLFRLIDHKLYVSIILLLLFPNITFSQCQVVINEIMFGPNTIPGNSMHDNATPANADSTAEWIELYNPSACNSVDISCWILGSDETNTSIPSINYGVFVFPNGTIIPPHGFLVVGGAAATTKDFNSQTSSNYCGFSRWFLQNANGWVALYSNTGSIVDAVYWSTSGSAALNTSSEFNNSLITNSGSVSCSCSGTVLNNTVAKNIAGIEFAGTSTGGLNQGWKRTIDGATTWASEVLSQSTPKTCNGACMQALSANITSANPTSCGGTGSATVTPSGATAPYIYSWSNGATSQSISNLTAGTYSCTVTDACGCSITRSVTISSPPSPFSLSISGTNVSCFGVNDGSVQVTVSGGTSPYSYAWSSGGSTNSQANNLSAGSYTVNVTDAASCTGNATITITSPPSFSVSVTSDTICEGQSTTLIANATTPGGTFSWSPIVSNTSNITVSPSSTTNYTVTYQIGTCSVTSVSQIVVTPSPNLVISPDTPQINLGDELALQASGGIRYTWSNGDTTNTTLIAPQESVTMCVTSTNTAGCTASKCVEVKVTCESTLYIPNCFTPNGDLVNDIFSIPSTCIKDFHITIYSRWGELIFESDDILVSWDGKYKNKDVPDGVYVFIINAKGYDNTIYRKPGHVTVLR